MTIKEAIVDGVKNKDAKRIGRIVDMLRFRHRASYDQCLEFINRSACLDKADFDDLMIEYEAMQ